MISGYFLIGDIVERMVATGAPWAARQLAAAHCRAGLAHVPPHLRDDVIPGHKHKRERESMGGKRGVAR